MLSAKDLLLYPYSPELTQAGIDYVCRVLPQLQGQPGGRQFNHLRALVAQKSVELAFLRLLSERQVPHEVIESPTFAPLESHRLTLGRRRCRMFAYLISDRKDINRIRGESGFLLSASAFAPREQVRGGSFANGEVYVFAFLLGLVTKGQDDLSAAVQNRQPNYLMYPMPKRWVYPAQWLVLAPLAVKADTSQAIDVELGGLDGRRTFVRRRVRLSPRQRVEVTDAYHALSHLHVSTPPDGPVGVHSPRLGETVLIQPGQWGNLWVYGLQIILAGYMHQEVYHRRARRIPPGSRKLQYGRTREDYLALPLRELRPLADLFGRVREWAQP